MKGGGSAGPAARRDAPRRSGGWPAVLWLVRHGESSGNVARDEAEAGHRAVIDIPIRDMDVPLSARGEEQAGALGRWLRGLPAGRRPTAVIASPYVRALSTAEIALREAGLESKVPLSVDERLREREFGVLDRLTRAGIEERFPEQAEARRFLGKFYHRPPGGESWCDVALRVRSMLDTVAQEHSGGRLLAVGHQVVILMTRYVVERLTEREILDIDREHEVANCSVTTFVCRGGRGRLELESFNDVSHLEQMAQVTHEPDEHAGTG